MVALGHEGISLGAQLDNRGSSARRRSLTRGRLLAGGKECRRRQQEKEPPQL
jgi:hypothetical protein